MSNRPLRRKKPRRNDFAIEAIASTVQRLAVLLGAGIAPQLAWGYLSTSLSHQAPSGTTDRSTRVVVAAAAEAASRGGSVTAAIRAQADSLQPGLRDPWSVTATAWSVAADSGAPVAECLRRIAGSLRDVAALRRELDVALAGPKATAKLVTILPFVAIAMGWVLGFNTAAILFTTLPGIVCVVLGSSLILAASYWNAKLIAAATQADPAPGLKLDLIAIAMSGGVSIERAVHIVEQSTANSSVNLSALRGSAARRVSATRESQALDSVLALSRAAGVPASELLRSEAEQLRRTAKTDGQRRAATVAIKLMLPLSVCIFPAFVLLGVVPLITAVLSSTLGALT